MANLNDLKNNLKKIKEAVTAKMPDIAVTLTVSAKAISERKIREVGFGASYSNEKYPAWFLHGKELNAQGATFLQQRGVNPQTGVQGTPKKKRRKKGETGPAEQYDKLTNWKEFRAAQGLPVAHVDLGYSNKMYAGTGPVKPEQRGNVYISHLGGTNIEAQTKLNYNRDRYGDFVAKVLGDPERQILVRVVTDEVVKVLEQFKI